MSSIEARPGLLKNLNSFSYSHFWDLYRKGSRICLFAILYHKILKTELFKKIIKYAALAYFIFATALILSDINALFKSAYTILYISQTVIILLCAIFYFLEVLEGDKILFISKSLYFYISFTIFFWWLITTPLIFFDKYYILEDKNYVILKTAIYIFANIFMYTTFSIGLIVSKPDKS